MNPTSSTSTTQATCSRGRKRAGGARPDSVLWVKDLTPSGLAHFEQRFITPSLYNFHCCGKDEDSGLHLQLHTLSCRGYMPHSFVE